MRDRFPGQLENRKKELRRLANGKVKDCVVTKSIFNRLLRVTPHQVNISCQINKSLQQITANVQKFGEINVNSDPCDFSVQKRKDRQAQIMVALPTKNIDNLTLTLQKRINTKLSDVFGCSLLPDDYKIRVFKSDGSKDFEIKDIGRTFDVVFIGDDSIAVTSGESNKINIIDLKTHKLKEIDKS
ncbi:unnamed protein product [Mytilus edulis]|uniref:Uncharacterized protein n=1 Tax=Mytilus edulis TaxID=6550 RepID=A0A8S3SVW7_MYTED|nr:unnamed protein product [Mytilus edulis]